MLIKHQRHHLRVAEKADEDGDLHILTSSSGLHLTPAEQDELLKHLIQARGAGRVQELLKQPWDGVDRRA